MTSGAWPTVGAGGRLVALVTDLMDRSRISAARPEVSFLRGPVELAGLGEHDVVLVDLGRIGVIEALAGCGSRTGGGTHFPGDNCGSLLVGTWRRQEVPRGSVAQYH